MTNFLKHVFPTARPYGAGLFCSELIYEDLLTLDYYDGIIEGVACIASSDYVFYFKKVWWDELQNYRLFEGTAVSIKNLQKDAEDIYEIIKNYNVEAGAPSEEHKALNQNIERIKQLFLSDNEKNTFHFLTNDLRADLYIVPLGRE